MYLLPKPKTIKEQDGQMLLCHSTHIVMTKEVAERQRCVQQKDCRRRSGRKRGLS